MSEWPKVGSRWQSHQGEIVTVTGIIYNSIKNEHDVLYYAKDGEGLSHPLRSWSGPVFRFRTTNGLTVCSAHHRFVEITNE